jgi:hypothetical protein
VYLVDDESRSVTPDTVVASEPAEEDDLEELRKKFVGEIDLPESMSSVLHMLYRLVIVGRRRGAIAQRFEAPLRPLPHSISRGQ